MITNFNLYEGRGISDIIKEYSKIIYDDFIEYGMNNLQYDFDYESLPLLDLRIVLDKSDINHAEYDLDKSNIIDKKLYNITIYIKYIFTKDVRGLLIHELNHIKEYYSFKSNSLKIKIKPSYVNIRNSYNKLGILEGHSYYLFIYLLYLSLDTEMNARISQVYDYLFDFGIKDEQILFNKLKEHKNWEYVEMLNDFDYKKFVDNNIDKIGESGLINITNDLINNFKDKDLNKNTKLLYFIDKNVENYNDLIDFYQHFSTYFKEKTKKHIEHFQYMIKEVVEDLNGNRPYNEDRRWMKKMMMNETWRIFFK